MTIDMFKADAAKGITIPDDGSWLFVSYGGGVDSTAMLIELRDAGLASRVAAVTFSDTGAEKPDTYHYIRSMDAWLEANGFPRVTWVSKTTTDRVEYSDLEGNCVDNETLPSLAFGMKSCSIKWKADAINYSIKGCKRGPNKCDPHPAWIESQEKGIKPFTLIGYDAGPADLRRSSKIKLEDDNWRYNFPLIDLGMTRPDCVKTIVEEGLQVPIKSACFFCPASKKWELWWLAGAHPDLFERALILEYKAMIGKHSRFDKVEFGDDWESLIKGASSFPSSDTTVGLGRSFAWNHWARVNKVVDDNGTVIMPREECLARADADKGTDNALDIRSC